MIRCREYRRTSSMVSSSAGSTSGGSDTGAPRQREYRGDSGFNRPSLPHVPAPAQATGQESAFRYVRLTVGGATDRRRHPGDQSLSVIVPVTTAGTFSSAAA